MAPPPEHGPLGLERHGPWLRDFARRLAAEAHAADDLVQDAWVGVLRRPRRGVRSVRAYLAGVLRNRHRQAGRATIRRREHEARAAEARGARVAPGAGEVVERAELARALLDRVLALDEPFRTVVLLRYADGLSAPEVAERLGVPVKTVESRARRGAERLREAWERGQGGREDGTTGWLSALACVARSPRLEGPLAPPPRASASPAAPALSSPAHLVPLGALAMQTKLILATVAVAGVAGGVWLVHDRDTAAAKPLPAPVALPPVPAELAQPETEPAEPEPAPEAIAARTAVPAPAVGLAPAAERAPAPPALPTRLVRGRVYDVDASPVGGVPVLWTAGWEDLPADPDRREARTVSAGDGSFELPVERHTGLVRADAPELVTLVTGRIQGSADVEVPLVVAPYRELAGRVVDEGGRPVADAVVDLRLPPGFLGRFDAVLDATEMHLPGVQSGEDGVFRLERAAVVSGARLVARLDGWIPAELEAPPERAFGLELVLRRPEDPDALIGRVVEPDGTPAPGAWVSLGGRSAVSDANGEFALSREGAEGSNAVSALLAGRRPARLEVERDPTTDEPLWPAWIELVLGAEPLTLEGRVVDERGAPRAGVAVWIEDPTPFGVIGDDETNGRVEFLLAHGASPAQADLDAYWYSTDTGTDGAFELPGLLDREYRVRLLDAERRESHVAGPVRPGLRAELEFPREPLGRLAGRVVARDGSPVESVLLFLECATYGGVWTQTAWARTGEDGRFAFEDVGNARVSLMIRGDGIVPRWDFFDGDPRAEELEITVDRLCHLRVELADPGRADGFRVLDADGGGQQLYAIGATGITHLERFELIDGRSRTAGVAESAATLVLELDGAEVERVPLQLVPGELSTVLR